MPATKKTFIPILLLTTLWGLPVPGQTLWDNGDANGDGSASQSREVPYRSTLDDFEIPCDEIWAVTGFRTIGIWSNFGTGQGTGYELTLWTNVPNAHGFPVEGPGRPLSSLLTSNYREKETGRIFFGRSEVEVWVDVDPFPLESGRYWLEMHMLSPENFFQLEAPRNNILLNPLWIYYEDFPPTPQPFFNAFGIHIGMSFQLFGTIVPELSSFALLWVAGLAILRLRPRRQ